MNFEIEIDALRADLSKLGEVMTQVASSKRDPDAGDAIELCTILAETVALQSATIQKLLAEVAAHRERILEL